MYVACCFKPFGFRTVHFYREGVLVAMAKTLSKTELQAGIDNAILRVIDTCGGEVDSAISNGLRAEYKLGSEILSESEKIHLADGEKLTGSSEDKKVFAVIKKSRNAIVDGLIESGRFDFGRTKFLDAVRVAAKFGPTDFENLSQEFNRTAIIELASVADDKVDSAIDAVRGAQEKAAEKDAKPPNVREIVKGFKPKARKSGSVPFTVKLAQLLANELDAEFFGQLDSKAGVAKGAANDKLAAVIKILAENGSDVRLVAERVKSDKK